MFLRQISDPYLAQYAYLIGCQRSGEALIIDPLRDIDRYIQIAKENNLRITAVAETHIHADFVSGAQEFAEDPNLHIYLSAEGGADWTYRWPKDRPNTHYLKNEDVFKIGNIQIKTLHTPGHTPEHICFLVTDFGASLPMAIFSGDFIFAGDVGRPDLLESAAGVKNVMEPSARMLQQSLSYQIKNLPDYLQIFPGHGAGSACGKSLGAVPSSTVGYERQFNSAMALALKDQDAFVSEILLGQPNPPLYFATMKRVNRDGIRGKIKSAKKLTVPEFRDIADNSDTIILDTRDSKEAFDKSHIKRAINAPLRSSFFYTSAGSFIAPEQPILLALESEKDLDLAIRQLYRIGLDNITGWILLAEAAELLNSSTEIVLFSEFEASGAAIVDVRDSAEHSKGHYEGAYLIPYTRLKERLSELPADRKLFVHCASGKRATLAASFLKSQGFDVVQVDGNYQGPKFS